jgi:peptidoglycan/xylan/chitin deacetylase (PgdA/CDA1 family)
MGNSDLNEQGQEINTEDLDEKSEDDKGEEVEENNNNNDIDIEDDKEEADVEIEEEIKPDPGKKVFLTFDDGPSALTPEILKILDESKVKATFFTIGKSVEKNPHWVEQTYDEGHMILPHTYSHDYSIYTTTETYYNDFELAKKSIEDVLDIEIPNILRFPGGSSNHSSFKYGGEEYMPKLTVDVKEKGYYYIDWNVSSGDASPDYDKKDKMISNVIDGAKNKDFIVVLFHDTARNTMMAEVLPEIISELKNQGYTFRTFRDITEDELDTMVKLKVANKPIVR